MKNLMVSELRQPSVGSLEVELVERKGLGHPDTLCDSIAENLSQSLCRYYLKEFGAILHHNVDKVLLAGGSAEPCFKGGEVLEPIEIFFVGRAVREFKGTIIPVEELAIDGTREWFSRNLHELDPYRHLKIHCLIRPGSVDLADLFARSSKVEAPLSNDTSIGVGYAPLTPLEKTVLALERELNSRTLKERFPEYGTDIKVMGFRLGGRMELTVPCAFVDRYVFTLKDYFNKKQRLIELIQDIARSHSSTAASVEVNTADRDTPESLYLTVTGTSAEAGDDGQVGRGNRANGLITPYRPMTMEAFSGKNPVTHTGKLYQIAAQRIAERVASAEGVEEAECYLVSQIGKPITEPQVVDLKWKMGKGLKFSVFQKTVQSIVEEELSRLPVLWKELIAEPAPTP